MASYIEPRILKGFRDFLPATEIARKNLVEKIELVFRSYGFVPIDTPALEYAEILLGKGGGETEKQIYRFNDNGGRDVALRFDLTVPFARFLAEHREELVFPFKRYHIAKVWRGENTQRGRYREFTQCDVDTIGSDSAACDFEILHIMRKSLSAVAGGEIIIHLNHRGVFNRFLSRLDAQDKTVDILRTVDKLAKIGRDETLKLLEECTGGKAEQIVNYVEIRGGFDETLAAMEEAAGSCPEIERLKEIRRFMLDSGIAGSVVLDPSITRGLDYYTGVVFESFLADLPDIGSVCSGGRYDNLVALYSKERRGAEPLTGVGASIGIDRLVAGLETLKRLPAEESFAKVAVAWAGPGTQGACQALADILREKNIPCEVFIDEEKLTRQFQRAEKKSIRWLIIPDAAVPARDSAVPDTATRDSAAPTTVSDTTVRDGALTLRDLSTRENREGLRMDEIAGIVTQNRAPR